MAWALVTSTGQGIGGSGPTATPINTTGATLLIAATSQFSGSAAATFSDSPGNTWQSLSYTSGGSNASQLFYCYNPITSASHTFTLSGSSLFASIGVVAFSGSVGSGPADASAVLSGTGGTSINAGSITSTANGDLIISSLAQSGTDFTGLAVSSGTIVANYPLDGGGNGGIAIAWQSQSSAGAIDPTWTWTNASAGNVADNVAFKATLVPPVIVDYRNGFTITGASSTQGPFGLLGGKYGVSCNAGAFGTVALQTLGPDGSTYVTVQSFTANGVASVDLPSGLYQVAITAASAVNINVIPISKHR